MINQTTFMGHDPDEPVDVLSDLNVATTRFAFRTTRELSAVGDNNNNFARP